MQSYLYPCSLPYTVNSQSPLPNKEKKVIYSYVKKAKITLDILSIEEVDKTSA